METKTCGKCNETKPATEFYRTDAVRGYLRKNCKDCDRETSKRYYQEHPEHAEHVKARSRLPRKLTLEEKRAAHAEYMRNYIANNPEQREKQNARSRAYQKAHPELYEKRRDYILDWHKQNPVPGDRKRRNEMRSLYGLSPDDFKRMHDEQQGKCKLCGSEQSGFKKRAWKWQIGTLSIDHCHDTGRVRGLLCHICNVRIGALERLHASVGLQKVWPYLQWGELNDPPPATPTENPSRRPDASGTKRSAHTG